MSGPADLVRCAPVRYAMVGGGEGAFIGAVHRTAAAIADCRLVAGAFSSDAERSARSGAALGLDPGRIHGDWRELIADEARRSPGERAQFVAIVTPNHLHAPVAIAALEAGLPVLCDKPLAGEVEAAERIAHAEARTGALLGVTHTYAGYPLVQEMRAQVRAGALGAIRRAAVSYTQDWLSQEADAGASAQAAWRTDPARSGRWGAFGDIGSHALDLLQRVTGERVTALSADLRSAVPGRALDDDGAALLRLSGGGRGVLTASQVCTGDINRLTLSLYGEDAALHWSQEDPNRLVLARRDAPAQVWTAGANPPYLSPAVRALARTPAGHPEGYIEAFANLYRAFAEAIAAGAHPPDPLYATAEEAVSVLRLLAAAQASSDGGGGWVAVEEAAA